jgi:hypothetical protein
MSKRALKKSKRRSKAVVPALGITGLSLSLASGVAASTGGATDVQLNSQPHELFLGEEEVFDTSLSAFYTFDRENGEPTSLAQQVKLVARGGCGGCGCGGRGCGGCARAGIGCARAGMGCARAGIGCARAGIGCARAGFVRGFGRCAFHVHCRCAFFRRCFGCGCSGCGGCGGWGCGTCWIWTPTWGWINTCWSESTPAGEETRVASEQITQTGMAEEKK